MAETPKLDFSKSAISRYLQLATLFRRRIDRGEWKLGEQIPTVDRLVEECGVARATVRHALGLLESDGLIERCRAKGTFVKKVPSNRLWYDVVTDLQGLLLPRESAKIELLTGVEERMPIKIPHDFGVAAGSYMHFFRRHSRRDIPFAVIEVYLAQDIYVQLSPTDLVEKTTLQLLIDLPGVDVKAVKQSLTIETADIHIAERLNISINSPVAVVLRYMMGEEGRILAISEGRYPGEMVRLDMTMK